MSIADNLSRLHEEIAAACRRAGRADSDVALMAVSKVHPVEAILEAYAAGQRLFGENRVQEFQEKSAALGALTRCGVSSDWAVAVEQDEQGGGVVRCGRCSGLAEDRSAAGYGGGGAGQEAAGVD